MEKLIQAMKIAFASEFNFYLRSHACHWNVVGPDFNDFHQMFGDIYAEVYSSIDSFAENIRKLDALVEVDTINQYSMVNLPDSADNQADPMAMVEMLLGDNERLVKLFAKVYELADAEREYGLSNFLAERQDAHRKHGWMLRSVLKRSGGIE